MLDLFITQLSSTGRIVQYSIYNTEHSMNIECVAHFEVDEIKNYTDFKVVNGELTELTVDEKNEQIDICPTPPPTNEELNNQLIETQKLCLSLQKQILLK